MAPVWIRLWQQLRQIDEIRDEVLEALGYEVIRQRQCEWIELRKSHSSYAPVVKELMEYEKIGNFWQDVKGLIPSDYLFHLVLKAKFDGIIFVDIDTPEELKEKYQQFAPIIQHATAHLKDISPYMQRVAANKDIKFGPEGRNMVIDSYFGENIGLTCQSLKQQMEMGLKVTTIWSCIRYKPFPIFKPFVDKIIKLRMQGEVDKNKTIIANMAKLLGNSTFGSCITDVEKHREVSMMVVDGNDRLASRSCELKKEIASRKMFKNYEVVTQK